ncbi:uncharacterized protein PFB0765w-like [Chelonus insularis]|uniref:uncharacterized protein PFB0765w-like n=1 Tax=Chelonus insularis TaxID=460826 RepID=UPI00158F3EC7|nr:uncharacterized protein PFB0765w-like [Chelonus insularis]
MIEISVGETDSDNIEVLVDSTLNTEKSIHLINPFAQFKSKISNKRFLDQSHNNSDIEQCAKKVHQELRPIQSIIESNKLLDHDIIEIEDEVKEKSGNTEGKMDKTELSKLQHNSHDRQKKNNHNTQNFNNYNNTLVSDNKEECEVVWAGIGDKSMENYIKEEVKKRVKEKVEAFESMTKAQMEHERILMNKYRKIETEYALELEKQKNEKEDKQRKNEIQEEYKDEFVQAILFEKNLEEKELILRNRIERLKLIESKFVQQTLEIKLLRQQNRELLKMKIKEWEDKEKLNQEGQQGISIEDYKVLINNKSIDCECIDDIITNKSKSSTEEIKYVPKLNELQERRNTQLLTNRAEREKCRPTRMSHEEWENEKKERDKRNLNLKIKGLKSEMGPKDLETYLKREMGIIVKVKHVMKVGKDIIVQLKDMIYKRNILQRVKPNNSGISIINDFTCREEEVQKWLRDEADWLRLNGYSVKTKPMRLMINGINWVWNEVLGDLIPERI